MVVDTYEKDSKIFDDYDTLFHSHLFVNSCGIGSNNKTAKLGHVFCYARFFVCIYCRF